MFLSSRSDLFSLITACSCFDASIYDVLSISSLPSPHKDAFLLKPTPILTVALTSGAGCQGNGMLHGSAQAWESTVTVAKASSVDVELGVLGGEGRCSQGVCRVSQGCRLPQAPSATGRLVQRDLLILKDAIRGFSFQNDVQEAVWIQTQRVFRT